MRHLFSKIGRRLYMVNIRRAVDQFFHLAFCRGDYVRIAVTGINNGDAGKAINVLPPVRIRHKRATGFINHDRADRFHKTRNEIVLVFLKCIRDIFLFYYLHLSTDALEI